MKKRTFKIIVLMISVGFFAGGSYGWFRYALASIANHAPPKYVRVEKGDTLKSVLQNLEKQGVIRSAFACELYARFTGESSNMRSGTYQIAASYSGRKIVDILLSGEPIKRDVLIREGLWLERTADMLEKNEVATKEEALEIFQNTNFATEILGFKIPAETLEGYLFPDTYDMPPLLGAKRATEKMLTTFRTKVYEKLDKPSPEEMHKLLIIASMIELEAVLDEERPRIAGVIYNRLEQGMRLQIDATVAYAKGEWAPVLIKDYQIDHPYNTYRIDGLPPGPICSPGLASIKAAKEPEKHDWLFYVAMPDRSHIFSKTYKEHLENIKVSREAFRKASGSGQ